MEEKKKMRIVHIVQSPGGVERYLQVLFKYTDREKCENILIASEDYKKEKYISLVDAFENVNMIRAINLKNDIIAIINVRGLIKKYKPDIVYCHSSKAGAIGRIASLGLHNICIYNPHGWAFNMRLSGKKQKKYIWIERLLANFCRTIVCISEAEKLSALDKKICKKEKVQVICNGIDFDEYNANDFAVTREDLAIPQDAFVVGMVGRLSQQKAPDVFIDAAKIIKQTITNAFFLFVGDGENEKMVRTLADEYGLKDSFFITGWVHNPMAYIKMFDVAMLLSRWEGFGLVLPEYMLAQKPIVATNVDAIPYIVEDQVNGLLVNVDDPDSTAKAVIELYHDAELRERLVYAGMEIVFSKFDAKRVALETETLFEDLLSKRGV